MLGFNRPKLKPHISPKMLCIREVLLTLISSVLIEASGVTLESANLLGDLFEALRKLLL